MINWNVAAIDGNVKIQKLFLMSINNTEEILIVYLHFLNNPTHMGMHI